MKGTWFTTYKEDISIKRELALEHHQVLPSSVACTSRTESKWCLALHPHRQKKTHKDMLSDAAKYAHGMHTAHACMQTHTHTHIHLPHMSAAQWGTAV